MLRNRPGGTLLQNDRVVFMRSGIPQGKASHDGFMNTSSLPDNTHYRKLIVRFSITVRTKRR